MHKIGLLQPTDTEAAVALSDSEGWNQTAADWDRLRELDRSGCFAARDGDRLVGTVTTTSYGTSLGWIGMMIVHPDFRHRRFGAALMRAALDHLRGRGITSIGLDATPAGRPLYESLGFGAVAELERWQGPAEPNGVPAVAAVPDAHAAVTKLDAAAYRVNRSALLDRLIADGEGEPIIATLTAGSPEGYVLARRGQLAAYIGPLVATSAGVATRLLDAVLARLAGRQVCLDLHRGGLLEPTTLADRAFSMRRTLTRMYVGPAPHPGTSSWICASAGPELG
jgi:GNAT superfamily N-acetyltransferase